MKKRVTIATGNVDSQGDILNIKGMKTAPVIPVTRNFDHHQTLGYAENIAIENNELKADIDIPDDLGKVWPAMGMQFIETETDANGNRVVKEFKIYEVSLCDSPNVDSNVPPISKK